VAQELLERGFKNVHPLFGGFDAWEQAGLPLDSKAGSASPQTDSGAQAA